PRLSQLCPPCATPFSNSSLDYRRSDARIVENGFAASSGVSKSAKVVLDFIILLGLCLLLLLYGWPSFLCCSWRHRRVVFVAFGQAYPDSCHLYQRCSAIFILNCGHHLQALLRQAAIVLAHRF